MKEVWSMVPTCSKAQQLLGSIAITSFGGILDTIQFNNNSLLEYKSKARMSIFCKRGMLGDKNWEA